MSEASAFPAGNRGAVKLLAFFKEVVFGHHERIVTALLALYR